MASLVVLLAVVSSHRTNTVTLLLIGSVYDWQCNTHEVGAHIGYIDFSGRYFYSYCSSFEFIMDIG